MPYFLFPGRSLNLVPRVLSYQHYGAREKTGRRENLGTRLAEAPVAEGFELDIFGIPQLETVDCKTRYLFTSKTDKARLSDQRDSYFATEAQEIVWDFCTWEWKNLQLSDRTVSKYKWFIWDHHKCCWSPLSPPILVLFSLDTPLRLLSLAPPSIIVTQTFYLQRLACSICPKKKSRKCEQALPLTGNFLRCPPYLS